MVTGSASVRITGIVFYIMPAVLLINWSFQTYLFVISTLAYNRVYARALLFILSMALYPRQNSSFIFNIQVFVSNVMFTILYPSQKSSFIFNIQVFVSNVMFTILYPRQKSSFIFNIQVFVSNLMFTILYPRQK